MNQNEEFEAGSDWREPEKAGMKRRRTDHRVVMSCGTCGPWSSHTRAAHATAVGTMFTQAMGNKTQEFLQRVVNPIVERSIRPKYIEQNKLTMSEVASIMNARPESPTVPWSSLSSKSKTISSLDFVKFCPGRIFCALLIHSKDQIQQAGLQDFQVFKWAKMISEAETPHLVEPPPEVILNSNFSELIESKRDTRDVVDPTGVRDTLRDAKLSDEHKVGRQQAAERRLISRRNWTHTTPQYPHGPPQIHLSAPVPTSTSSSSSSEVEDLRISTALTPWPSVQPAAAVPSGRQLPPPQVNLQDFVPMWVPRRFVDEIYKTLGMLVLQEKEKAEILPEE